MEDEIESEICVFGMKYVLRRFGVGKVHASSTP